MTPLLLLALLHFLRQVCERSSRPLGHTSGGQFRAAKSEVGCCLFLGFPRSLLGVPLHSAASLGISIFPCEILMTTRTACFFWRALQCRPQGFIRDQRRRRQSGDVASPARLPVLYRLVAGVPVARQNLLAPPQGD